jgi:hypothetical protein
MRSRRAGERQAGAANRLRDVDDFHRHCADTPWKEAVTTPSGLLRTTRPRIHCDRRRRRSSPALRLERLSLLSRMRADSRKAVDSIDGHPGGDADRGGLASRTLQEGGRRSPSVHGGDASDSPPSSEMRAPRVDIHCRTRGSPREAVDGGQGRRCATGSRPRVWRLFARKLDADFPGMLRCRLSQPWPELDHVQIQLQDPFFGSRRGGGDREPRASATACARGGRGSGEPLRSSTRPPSPPSSSPRAPRIAPNRLRAPSASPRRRRRRAAGPARSGR